MVRYWNLTELWYINCKAMQAGAEELPFDFVDGTPATCRKLESIILFTGNAVYFEDCTAWHELTYQ